ncbi:MAG TPA: diphosphate--fructose-6-phosphate 1-phosphotransferase [Candidatus Hydromicrobium sp.]
MKNVVIAQSGGPTSVINNSIRGTIEALVSSNKINKIYGAKMGILGVLEENLLDISCQSKEQISRLSETPSAGVLGSCRYKIKNNQDLERIVEVFKKHNIGNFFYCGGGDSMDTANKINILAKEKGFSLVVAGIPKTIDNDVGGKLKTDGTFDVCDHDPGYGSVARNTAINVIEANQENMASYTSDPVLAIGVMGRKIGFIPASARLADPERKIPLLIILPESMSEQDSRANLEFITGKVNEKLSEFGRCIVVIGEGVNLGNLGILKDNFGHIEYGSTATSVEQILTNYLNGLDKKDGKTRLVVRGNVRCEKPGTRQRRETTYVSDVDLSEAYKVGEYAANIALKEESGYMSTILRVPGRAYKVMYDKVLLETVANSEREFPKKWITEDKIDVTDDFIKWAMPLIGGNLPNLCKFKEVYAEKKCSSYIPYDYRG